jgi:hypothetical protein
VDTSNNWESTQKKILFSFGKKSKEEKRERKGIIVAK